MLEFPTYLMLEFPINLMSVPNEPDVGVPYHDGVPYKPDVGVPNQPDIGASSLSDKGTKRYSGIVKWFNIKKGFGFIRRNNNLKDIFVNQSSFVKKTPRHRHPSLNDKETVEFEIKQDKKGLDVAINVTGPSGYGIKGKEAFENSSYSYEDYNYKSQMGPVNCLSYGSRGHWSNDSECPLRWAGPSGLHDDVDCLSV